MTEQELQQQYDQLLEDYKHLMKKYNQAISTPVVESEEPVDWSAYDYFEGGKNP